ncbi:T-cell differentiation antigen CD6 isoform X6 [Apodemus sylvaticus]|uniref:T-cell differentiation antigen CD6 isoform X6 n=1 Tax=Apodemus sylvaticus TaxID=10129 RepID=UPI002242498F|nr:T-cell differentiation antigen CD6 isoform X6 [Apodemus sylvaticus]
MAPDMWLFLGITGLLTAVLSGLPSPVPSGQHRNDSTPKTPVDPEEQLGIRLVNGSSRCSGSVEVLLESWEPVCAAHWNWAATKAVCNALGCGDSGKVTYLMPPTSELPSGASSGNTSSSGNTTWARAPTVRCSGAHWQLCKVEDQECGGDRPLVWVTCAENQAVRLVDGGSRCAGRVEMLEHGEWGTVCDDTWDLEDAHVVCKQLKCGWAVKALAGLHFTPGQGPIHRDQVNCSGTETYLWDCPGRPGDQYCGHKEDAGVVCSGSQRHPNLSTSEVPSRIPVTRESSVLVSVKDKDSQELTLLIPCIVLGSLLFISLIFIAILLLRAKGRYALPASVNHQQLSTDNQSGINNYHPVPITIAKEAPTLFFQPRVPEDSDSSSDSDYEHYDFSSQPPVALTTFYNSQRHRVTEEEAQQNRFRMPPLEEGLEELHVSHTPPADPRPCVAEAPSLGSQYHMRSNSDSSTSSEEGYCNDPSSKPPPWNSQAFSSEKSPLTQQPPNLELAGSQAVFSAGPSANDSSSTSSGEWYQNFQLPPQHPPVEQFECPGPPDPQANSIDDDEEEEEDYDDIGAA